MTLRSESATEPSRSKRSQTRANGERYLEATVQTASPAKLRLMLVERATEMSRLLADSWRTDENSQEPGMEYQDRSESNEHALKLLEILNELLSGVSANQTNDLGSQVADLYVFLLQHLVAAEQRRDAGAIDEISTVLAVEAETWRLVCAQESDAGLPGGSHSPHVPGTAASGGLNLQV